MEHSIARSSYGGWPGRKGRFLAVCALLLSYASSSFAYTEWTITDGEKQCWAMYGPGAVPGSNNVGTIKPLFRDYPTKSNISLLVYNYDDEALVAPNGKFERCENPAQNCTLGTWITKSIDTSSILNVLVNIDYILSTGAQVWAEPVYNATRTGVYCFVAKPFQGVLDPNELPVHVMNPYGELPAIEYPKLPFYGFLSLTYLLIGVGWMVLSFLNWRELLAIQHYISVVTIFLTLEMAFNYGFFEDFNHWGRTSKPLLVLVVILNAARNSISLFMLLIVALGYGVVRPTLGGTMAKCRNLALLHFVFGILYAASSLSTRDVTLLVALTCILPLSITLTIFYMWILKAITKSMEHLLNRRQIFKLTMYRRLWRILVSSIVIISIMFVVDIIFFTNRDTIEWLPAHWKVRWFLLDGWLNILYLGVFLGLAILWRPTENNQRYGLDELAQDDFEDEDFRRQGSVAGQQLNLRKFNGRQGRDEEEAISDTEFDEFEDLDDGEGGGGGADADDEDVMRWVEQNVGSEEEGHRRSEDKQH
ncbi:lung seven transmembrane receptor-domain-containing protein [Phlyctochytrium arcticum]|nr:lung seven transmembrane receptor-domain-containing protein [Phlyctochytrium arcticum]